MFRRTPPGARDARDGLVVGPEDAVLGSMSVRAATIAGRVDGALDVAGTLVVARTGRVSGAVRATRFVAEPGAVVRASVRVAPSHAEAATDPLDEALAAPDATVLRLTPRASTT